MATSPTTDTPTLLDLLDAVAARWPALDHLCAAIRDLADDLAANTEKASDYRDLAADGLRSPSLEPGRGGGGDPTGGAVVARCGSWPERAELRTRTSAALRIAISALTRLLQQDDQREARRRLGVIEEDLRAALGLAHRALPNTNTLKRIHEAERGEPGCPSCARVRDSRGRTMYAPTSRDTGGRDGLCRWCWEWTGDQRARWLEANTETIVDGWFATLVHVVTLQPGERKPAIAWPDPHDLWPAEQLVDDHHAGRRITTASVAKAERARDHKAAQARRKWDARKTRGKRRR
jgi:hypothetical protein